MNTDRLPSTPLEDGLTRLSREAASPDRGLVLVRGATNMRPVSRKGCWAVRRVPRSGAAVERDSEPRGVGVMNDRVGAEPSVLGAMFGLRPAREGVRERDGASPDGLRPIAARFRALDGPALDCRLLNGLREKPASPASDRDRAEGATCRRFVDGVVNGERVAEALLRGAVTPGDLLTDRLGDRLTEGLGAGVGEVCRRGATVAGVRLGATNRRVAEGDLCRLADGVLIGVRVPGVMRRGADTLGDLLTDGLGAGVGEVCRRGATVAGVRRGAANCRATEGARCRLGTGVREGVRAAGAADERFGALNPLEGARKIRGAGVAERVFLDDGAACRLTDGVKARLADGAEDRRPINGLAERRPTDGLDERRPTDGLAARRLTEGADDRRADREDAAASA